MDSGILGLKDFGILKFRNLELKFFLIFHSSIRNSAITGYICALNFKILRIKDGNRI